MPDMCGICWLLTDGFSQRSSRFCMRSSPPFSTSHRTGDSCSCSIDPFTDPQDNQISGTSSACSSSHSRTPHSPKHPVSLVLSSPSNHSTHQSSPGSTGQSKPLRHHLTTESQVDPQQSPERRAPASTSSASSYYALFENSSPESTAFRTSLVSHAAAQFSRQHCVFLFQLVIVDAGLALFVGTVLALFLPNVSIMSLSLKSLQSFSGGSHT